MRKVIINISTTAAGQGLKQELDRHALHRGMKTRAFVGQIYAFATNNKHRFRKLSSDARSKPGSNIGAVVSEKVKEDLDNWAKERQTSLGMLCCFILENVLEPEGLIDEIFNL